VIRRSFRFGLLLGLLGGVAFALTKVFGTQPPRHLAPAAGRATEPWPRLADDPTVAAPPIARPIPDPAAPVIPAPAPVLTVPSAEPPRAVPDPVRTDPPRAVPSPVPAEPPTAKRPAPVAKKAKTPPKKAAAKKKAPVRAWVEPQGGVCPTSHPVKAKLTSKIFHRPGMLNYERTNPDRCYADEAKAQSDGLRAAKR